MTGKYCIGVGKGVCVCVVGRMDTSGCEETQGAGVRCLSCQDGQHPERREVGQIAFCSVRGKCCLSLFLAFLLSGDEMRQKYPHSSCTEK